MMPKGVEHRMLQVVEMSLAGVERTMMPKGVEHSGYGHELAGLVAWNEQ